MSKGCLKIGRKYFYIKKDADTFKKYENYARRALKAEPSNAEEFIIIFNTLIGFEYVNPNQIGKVGAPVKLSFLDSASNKCKYQISLPRRRT